MNRMKVSIGILTLGFSACAFGQSPRTWVSGTGVDTNPCTRTAPCATFAAAYAVTSASGEIDALDPGSFGPLSITHPITIDGGVSTSTSDIVVSAGDGIDVAANTGDIVTLRNLNILGLGTGSIGVSVTGGASVRIQRVRVSGFTSDGFHLALPATSTVTLDDCVSNDNGGNGLYASNTGDITAVGVTGSYFSGNLNGIYAASGSKITVNDSQAIGNSVGFLSQSSASTLSSMTLYRCNASSNTSAGFKAGDGGFPATIRISKATSQFNGAALVSGGNGSIYSFADNSITGAGTPTAILPLR